MTANARRTADDRLLLLKMMLEHDWKSGELDKKHQGHKAECRDFLSSYTPQHPSRKRAPRSSRGGLGETEQVIVCAKEPRNPHTTEINVWLEVYNWTTED